MIEYAHLYRFSQIYETDFSEFKSTFRVIRVLQPYREYVKETQVKYFAEKERLMNKLKNFDVRDEKDYKITVHMLKDYNAINEEIVQLMKESAASQES